MAFSDLTVTIRVDRVESTEHRTTVSCERCHTTVDTHIHLRIIGRGAFADKIIPFEHAARVCEPCYVEMERKARLTPLYQDVPFTLTRVQ